MTLPVSEIFGPTFQGEGPSAGRLASFVRLGGCNLTCVWCDTPYTWDASRYDLRAEIMPVPVTRIVGELAGHRTGLVVVTGGEPLLYQHRPDFAHLITGLAELGEVEIETNGTIGPRLGVTGPARFNVSPKLDHSGNAPAARFRVGVLEAFVATGRAVFKFVARNSADLDQVERIAQRTGIPARLIWIMPLGQTPEETAPVSRVLAQPVIDRGWNFTGRLHLDLWGSERGR